MSYRDTVLADNPVAYWRLGEAAGATVAQDETANNYDLTASGGVAFGQAGAIGPDDDTAAALDGVDDVLSSSVPLSFNNFTLELWAKPTATIEVDSESTSGFAGVSGERYAWTPDNKGSNAGVGVAIGTNFIGVYEHADNYAPCLLAYQGTFTDWTHVVVVYEAQTPKLYINGALVRTGLNSAKSQSYHPDRLGHAGYNSTDLYQGQLDEAAIYTSILTATQIQAHYDVSLYTVTPPVMLATATMAAPPVVTGYITPSIMTATATMPSPTIGTSAKATAFGYFYQNVGVELNREKTLGTGYLYENVGVLPNREEDLTAGYLYENVGVALDQEEDLAAGYLYENVTDKDYVEKNTPTIK